MSMEYKSEVLAQLGHGFKFKDAVLRHLTIKMKKAVTEPSPMMKEEKSKSMMDVREDAVLDADAESDAEVEPAA